MSTSFRHFRALSRKNAINWTRTPLGSITEIVCPVILMIILVYCRKITKPEHMSAVKISALRHPLFQPAKNDGPNGEFTISGVNLVENTLDMNSFMRYTKYTNLKHNFTVSPNITKLITNETEELVIDTYFPALDPLGPYLFYPKQCYANMKSKKKKLKYKSSLIAYIKKGNQIEEDLITQLDAMFSIQRNLGKAIKTIEEVSTLNSLFPGLINVPALGGSLLGLTGALGEIGSSGFNMSDIGLNATDDKAALGNQL